MKLLILALAAGIAATPKLAAAVESAPLQLKPKAAIVVPAPHRSAPFVSPTGFEPDLDLIPRRDDSENQSRSSCATNRTLCYDAGSGRIVYKPARQLMPDLPGLTRENISVKRDRIILRYSF